MQGREAREVRGAREARGRERVRGGWQNGSASQNGKGGGKKNNYDIQYLAKSVYQCVCNSRQTTDADGVVRRSSRFGMRNRGLRRGAAQSAKYRRLQ